ncbi:MAG: VOC family protein [Shinella sp.]|nr:VOC family protein [Shinella sp.]
MAGQGRLVTAEPQLFVADILVSCDYYAEKLGFEIAFVYGDPPFYAQAFRDEVRLNFRHTDRPVFDGRIRSEEKDLLSATIVVEDADALFQEYQATGAEFHHAIRTEDWGARTFIVKDPDGNLIAFAS